MKKSTEKNLQKSKSRNKDTKSKRKGSSLTKVTILQSRDIFMKSLFAHKYSESTMESYKGDFDIFYEYIKTELNNRVRYITDVKYHHLEFYKEFLVEKYEFTTAYRKFNCLRTYFKMMYRKNFMPYDIISSLKEDDFGINRRSKQDGPDNIKRQILSEDTINKLFRRIKEDTSKNAERNLALFCILFMGLRRSEVLLLKWENIDFEKETLSIYRPKNKTSDIVSLPNNAIDALTKYHESCTHKQESDKVFNMSTTTYNKMIKKYTVGLKTKTGDNIVGHSMRHTAVTHMVRNNVSLSEIQRFVGITLDTLQVYTHLSEKDTARGASVIDNLISA